MLTAASDVQTVSEAGKGAAAGVAALAQVEEAGASVAVATAAIPLIAANKLATASFMELAAASYYAAHAYIPFAGFGIATQFIADSVAAVQAVAVMPFAEGGVISGPTLGLMGEYPGAANNPEVVAPLDKLRSMIEPQGAAGGVVRFEIDGRKLVGVIANETRVSSKSGRRTNIKV